MIKMWKGIEQEGIGADSEVVTLFVCSTSKLTCRLITDCLHNHPDIKAVYLGAGREYCRGFVKDEWDKFLSYCKYRKIKIIVEIHPWQLSRNVVYDKYVLYIMTFYNAPDISNLYFKTDDYKYARIFTQQKEVDITSLQDAMYSGDVVLYEED